MLIMTLGFNPHTRFVHDQGLHMGKAKCQYLLLKLKKKFSVSSYQ